MNFYVFLALMFLFPFLAWLSPKIRAVTWITHWMFALGSFSIGAYWLNQAMNWNGLMMALACEWIMVSAAAFVYYLGSHGSQLFGQRSVAG